MPELNDAVALVTGASRGIGRGIAVALAAAGARVVATGRSVESEDGIAAIRCDHRDDRAVAAVFDRIERDHGRLDILVNNATAVPELSFLFSDTPFWEVPVEVWDDLSAVGLRSHFVAAQHAARLMVRQRSGLIVNISSSGAQTKIGIVPYGVAKAAVDRLTVELAEELKPHGVAVVSLWPPPSKTEGMLADAGDTTNTAAWSSTQFTGRVIAALAAADPIARTGQVLRVRELATQLGVEDDAVLS